MKTMEEKGFKPNVVTYNSLIKPLCKGHRVEEAKVVFDEMLQKGFSPTIRTYHAFFGILKTGEEIENVFKLWSEMSENGLSPDRSSYIVLIHGLFLNGKLEEAWKYYEEMKEKGFLRKQKRKRCFKLLASAEQKLFGTLDFNNQTGLDSSKKNPKVVLNMSSYEKDFRNYPNHKGSVEKGFSFWEK
ncbi:hypothetical protein IFM89_006419 [Coptis chinensis]|uniref:Pentatricopeptide repeat-containing protein n=1 Tax=Coptis chinensis TaxID=261450 RepID=A0A835HRC7_9MAGN|nr:hypothetical protein IFM89_006419 [Coptis chinensis]